MQNVPTDLIRCTSFRKSKETGIWKILPYKLPIDLYEEDGHEKEYAIVEAILSGEYEQEIRVRLHPDIQFSVVDGAVVFRVHPKDLADVFKCMVEYMRVAWVTEKTHREYMLQFNNPHLKPGAKTPSKYLFN